MQTGKVCLSFPKVESALIPGLICRSRRYQ